MKSVRVNIILSAKTDRAVRRYLASHGGRKGDLSRFVDDAVAAQLLARAKSEVAEPGAAYASEGIDARVLAKLRALSPERRAEAEDFLDFLLIHADERHEVNEAMSATAGLLKSIWDNPDDAAYDEI